MENCKIKIISILDKLPDSFSVEYEYDGNIKGHTFPKEKKLLDKDNDGIPDFVNELMEIEIERKSKESDFVKTAKPEIKEYSIKGKKIDEIKAKIEKRKNTLKKYEGDKYVRL